MTVCNHLLEDAVLAHTIIYKGFRIRLDDIDYWRGSKYSLIIDYF
jgi:hypothetical protein